MKILYDHQKFSHQRYGGISRYYYELITHILKEKNTDVSLFLGYFINEYGIDKYEKEFKFFFGKKHYSYPKSKLFYLYLNRKLFPKFVKKTEVNKYDIYHQTYYEYLIPDFKGKRIVGVYDMTHELYPDSFNRLDKTSLWKKQSLPNADGIICISQSTKNDLVRVLNIPEEKVKIIYLGNSIDVNITTQRIFREPYILYVAARKGYKNFKLLLSSYLNNEDINKNFKLVCFGGGAFTKEELIFFKKNNLSGKIFYFSGTDKILANFYKYASVLVYPSKYEGFGIPLLEALSIGCPVISSFTSSLPEIVGNSGLYINPDSEEDLTEKLKKILTDEELKNDFIQKGFEQSKKFSWDKCAKETLDYYKEILGK
jgi:glycosyltransferase involved in cell wall biosynthesis